MRHLLILALLLLASPSLALPQREVLTLTPHAPFQVCDQFAVCAERDGVLAPGLEGVITKDPDVPDAMQVTLGNFPPVGLRSGVEYLRLNGDAIGCFGCDFEFAFQARLTPFFGR